MQTKNCITEESGQATLELMILLAFIVVGLVLGVSFFFPGLKRDFIGVGNSLEQALESGREYR